MMVSLKHDGTWERVRSGLLFSAIFKSRIVSRLGSEVRAVIIYNMAASFQIFV